MVNLQQVHALYVLHYINFKTMVCTLSIIHVQAWHHFEIKAKCVHNIVYVFDGRQFELTALCVYTRVIRAPF